MHRTRVNALSQLLLAGTPLLSPDTAFPIILLGTASLGFGFGLSGAPLNGFPPLFFPLRRDTAIVALHTFLGLGLAVGPLIANPFIMAGHWVWFPLCLAGFAFVLIVLTGLSTFPESTPTRPVSDKASAMPLNRPMPFPGPDLHRRLECHPVRTASAVGWGEARTPTFWVRKAAEKKCASRIYFEMDESPVLIVELIGLINVSRFGCCRVLARQAIPNPGACCKVSGGSFVRDRFASVCPAPGFV
ncbi:MAG: hypothetical protein ACRERV_01800 [Methylococcales bacterium]